MNPVVVPRADRMDFVCIDDGGAFTYQPNAAEVLASFEYPMEAACILDRAGNCHRLALDDGRELTVTRPHG